MWGVYRSPSDNYVGPRYMNFDMWRLQGWELHTHGGFLTYPHHDAAGLCTYVYPRSGAKIWMFIRPYLANYSSHEQLFQDQDKLGIFSRFRSVGQMGTILLEPGHVLWEIFSFAILPADQHGMGNKGMHRGHERLQKHCGGLWGVVKGCEGS